MRLAHPKARLEGITSRPMLLAGVGRLTEHAGQSRIYLTINHASSDKIKGMIANIRNGIAYVCQTVPQLAKPERWKAMIAYIISKIIVAVPKLGPQHVMPMVALTSYPTFNALPPKTAYLHFWIYFNLLIY